MARIGEIIDGKYEILEEIGRGGMSIVYLAIDKRLNKQWAIKEFRKDKGDASKEVALKALLDEANLMKRLDHPTLPRIVDIIDIKTSVYIVMDYIEGESLNKVLDATGAQPQEAVIEWAKQLSDVLDYLHTQDPPVIYRDMKPANIMLKPDGTVRLIDFGIAREYKEGKEGDTEAIGTRGYAAPEQFGGRGQTDARTDIYSLGVTLYHLVTGKNPAEPPYEIYPIRHWDPSLSSGLEWLIQKCTQLNPEDRYQSCAEVSYVLENLDKFDVEYKKKQKSRIRIFWVTAALACVFAVASAVCFIGASRQKEAVYNRYFSKVTPQEVAQALDTYDNRNEVYLKIAAIMYSNDYTVAADSSSSSGNSKAVSEDDMTIWFSPERLEQIKKSSTEEYARINYTLGRLYFSNFDNGKHGGQEGRMRAKNYFGNVISAYKGKFPSSNSSEKKGESSGLSDTEYNLTEMYYKLLCLSDPNFSNAEDGYVDISQDKAAMLIIDAAQDGRIDESDYLLFLWDNCEAMLNQLNEVNDIELRPLTKARTIEGIAAILNKNRDNFLFSGKISGEDVQKMFELLTEELDRLNEQNLNSQNTSQEVLAACKSAEIQIKNTQKVFMTAFGLSTAETAAGEEGKEAGDS